MDKQKLAEIKKELSPDFDEYFARPDFDEDRLEFWLNELKATNESGRKEANLRGDFADFAARGTALAYLIFRGEI